MSGGPGRRHAAVILALAIVTMVVEMASLVTLPALPVGTLEVSSSTVPAAVLLLVLGRRSLGRAGAPDRLVPFWVAMAAGLALGASLLVPTGHGPDLVALLLAAVDEEVVYRLAVPLVIAAALTAVKVPGGPARAGGYAVAGVWWILLPGHQAQTDTLLLLSSYVAFAVISSVVVARSGALLPMGLAHCVLNVITIGQFRGQIDPAARSALVACVLFLLAGTFAWPGDQRDRAPVPAPATAPLPVVLDLRDGQRPSVRHGDDVTWLAPPAAPEAAAAGPTGAEPARLAGSPVPGQAEKFSQ